MCLNCGFLGDADNQAAINIGMKGLEILGLSQSKLLGVTQKVTGKPETTGSSNREKSASLETEPTNPNPPPNPFLGGGTKGGGFEWMNGQAIVC